MKRNPGYRLQRIANTEYLLPYGQQIVDHRRGISLNSTGVYVWSLLEKEISREELTSEYLKHFSDVPEPKEALVADLDQFLNHLVALRMIQDDSPAQPRVGKAQASLQIAGLTLALHGPDELVEASYLQAFRAGSANHADMDIFVHAGRPGSTDNGAVLLRSPELWVLERKTDYLLHFPTFSQINELSVTKDGAVAAFYCKLPFSEELGTEFFHALRHVFLFLAQKHGMYAIHSASICYADRAWLFSASSGTGKSTHNNVWNQLYGTEIINGDLNLLSIEDGRPVVHGIPWCGTSEMFDKRTLPLGGIVLLKRGEEDAVEELPPDKQALLVMQRFISPIWTGTQLKASARFAQKLSGQVPVCRLHCTKNPSAAETMKAWIDGNAHFSCKKC